MLELIFQKNMNYWQTPPMKKNDSIARVLNNEEQNKGSYRPPKDRNALLEGGKHSQSFPAQKSSERWRLAKNGY